MSSVCPENYAPLPDSACSFSSPADDRYLSAVPPRRRRNSGHGWACFVGARLTGTAVAARRGLRIDRAWAVAPRRSKKGDSAAFACNKLRGNFDTAARRCQAGWRPGGRTLSRLGLPSTFTSAKHSLLSTKRALHAAPSSPALQLCSCLAPRL